MFKDRGMLVVGLLVVSIIVSFSIILALSLTSAPVSRSSSHRTSTRDSRVSLYEPPEWIKEDPTAYSAYREAREIMTNPYYSRTGKQEKMRVLQKSVGRELLATIIRFVPVYDEKSGTIVTFDSYMRRMAMDYPAYDPEAPINYDPVGAAMYIFFDPTPENIAAMTGIGLSPQEVRAARIKYEHDQEQLAVAQERTSRELQKWSEEGQRWVKQAAQKVYQPVAQAFTEMQEKLEEGWKKVEPAYQPFQQAASEMERKLEEGWKQLKEGLGNLFRK